jgi:hypothetical protein
MTTDMKPALNPALDADTDVHVEGEHLYRRSGECRHCDGRIGAHEPTCIARKPGIEPTPLEQWRCNSQSCADYHDSATAPCSLCAQ